MNKLIRPVLALTTLALAAGPLSTSHAILDKTRFVAHLGVAYFAFHHWVLAPYKAGKFDKTATGRTAAMLKGGAALLFAAHEVNVAEKVAHASHDPLLQKLDGELVKLKGSFSDVGGRLKNGQFSADDISSLDQATNSIGQTSAAGGQPIKDIPTTISGL